MTHARAFVHVLVLEPICDRLRMIWARRLDAARGRESIGAGSDSGSIEGEVDMAGLRGGCGAGGQQHRAAHWQPT